MSDATLISAVFMGVIAGFYIMFMRPIQKEQKMHKQQIRDLRIGDRVLTTSNFIATVREIQIQESGETHISLELADGVVFTAMASAISKLLKEGNGSVPDNPDGPQ